MIVLSVSLGAHAASAALVPSYNLAQINNNTQVQITVMNATPESAVTLYYPVNSMYMTIGLGNTNTSGQLTTVVTPSTYNITVGSPSYVQVGGVQSNPQNWPQYSAPSATAAPSQGSLVVIPSSIVVTVGETKNAVLSANTTSIVPNISSNTNPSVAGVNANGTQLSVIGLSVGATQITVCAGQSGCATLPVTVQAGVQQQTTTVATGPVSINPGEISMYVGETKQVNISGGGTYFVGTQSNPGSISTSIVGNVLTVTALLVGNNSVGVCSQSGGSVNCTNLTLHLLRPAASDQNSSSQSTIAFDKSSLNLSVGQNHSVKVSGSGLGTYYVSSNTNPAAFTANISGDKVTVYATAIGAANITVCQFGGTCGQIYAYVPVNDVNVAAEQAQNQRAPLLSSYGVSSNNAGSKFAGPGSILTITFNTTEPVTKRSIKVAGSELSLLGSGTGTYSANYAVTGRESSLDAAISFSNDAGSGSVQFAIGGQTGGAAQSGASAILKAFTKTLRNGSIGSEVSALQSQLKLLGVYDGPVTGKFGSLTEAAVKRYQSKNGLKAVGEVGPATRELLNKGI